MSRQHDTTGWFREMAVFTGNSHHGLAAAVCAHLDMPLGRCEVLQFSNEEVFVRTAVQIGRVESNAVTISSGIRQ